MMLTKKQIKPKPFIWYYMPVLLLAFIGLADSIYLSISHYRVYTDISYKSFCAISKALNCDTVSQSSYSIFLGLPVPILGVLGYLLFFVIALFLYHDNSQSKKISGYYTEIINTNYNQIKTDSYNKVAQGDNLHSRRGWYNLLIISAIFSAYSVILALISNYYINSYCIMCILSYAVNFSLLFLTWLITRRFCHESFFKSLKSDLVFIATHKWINKIVIIFILFSLTLFIFFPNYWTKNVAKLTKDVPSGVTEDGHPWIGAENPELTIVEFADYSCFQCGKMHFYLRELIIANPSKIRLIHKHFPMDHSVNPLVKEPFHVGSGKKALLAIYAASKEKFWEMNDILYNIKENFNIKTIAKDIEINPGELAWAINSKEVKALLIRDIGAGLKLGVTGTPSFEINGKLYFGVIPPEILSNYLK